jgi:gamma-glutamyltranspeptidase / glutathione hydrolase
VKSIHKASNLFVFFTLLQIALCLSADGASPLPVRSRHGMVVSAHRLASEIGINIMQRGGNAVDAAVAVGFALAVVFPEAGNIGGGGFMLIRKHDGESVSIDFREKAPQAAQKAMFLDSTGNVIDKSINGHLSVGVPGTVAGFCTALQKFGLMPLSEIIQPAIDLAQNGFLVDQHLENNLTEYADSLRPYPATVKSFFKNGQVLIECDTLRQPDLALTLRRIQQNGADEFYQGETARLIVEEMHRGGGIITMEDLEEYEPILRKPLQGSYRGYEIVTMALPSSGGVCLLELLNLVEGFDLRAMGFHSSRSVHVMSEAMKRVYADRAEFLGDPDFVNVPVDLLISKQYANDRLKDIDTTKATPSNLIHHGDVQIHEGQHTTHYVVVDSNGTVVSTTYTLNDLFGSKVVVGGAGFFLNDEMDDFSVKPGVPNSYGLIGGDANAIEPKKRPLSSMVPTIVLKEKKPFMALGARGGSKIITSVFQTIVNVIDFDMNIQEAVDAPRFHHQWLPDEIVYERFCFPEDVIMALIENGYKLREVAPNLGKIEALYFDTEQKWIYGAPDPREEGVAIGY